MVTMELLFGHLEPMVVVLLVVFPFFMWAGVSFLLLLVRAMNEVVTAHACRCCSHTAVLCPPQLPPQTHLLNFNRRTAC